MLMLGFEKIVAIRVGTYCRDNYCTREQLKKITEEIRIDLLKDLKKRNIHPEDL